MFKDIKIPKKVKKVLEELNTNGYEGFIVGGCVRDSLLGKEPKDWDICTNAKPEEILKCFSNYRTIEAGKKYGTVIVLSDGLPIEITTYRIDGEYFDGRRPENVDFTNTLKEDLSRRDFTINAMAYGEETGIIDYFKGEEDLKEKIIRTAGNPKHRFQEDGLRIMRALRFSAQLGFDIHLETKKAIFEERKKLTLLSKERIRVELEKTLCGNFAGQIINEYRDVFGEILPEIIPMFDLDQKNEYHKYDLWLHTVEVINNIQKEKDLRLAALFHDIGKPESMIIDDQGKGHFYGHEHISAEISKSIMKRLRYDNKTRDTVEILVKNHDIIFNSEGRQPKRLLMKLGEENLRKLIKLELADVKGQENKYTEERIRNILLFQDKVEDLIKKGEAFSLKELKITGKDLLEVGVSQGQIIGEILNTLLNLVVEDKLENDYDVLMKKAKEIHNNKSNAEN